MWAYKAKRLAQEAELYELINQTNPIIREINRQARDGRYQLLTRVLDDKEIELFKTLGYDVTPYESACLIEWK